MVELTVAAAVGTVMVGGELVIPGVVKLARPGPSAARALGSAEVVVGVAMWALWPPARIVAAGLLLAFAGWQWRAVASGRSGTPCPCLGGATTYGRPSALRVSAAASIAAMVAIAPTPSLALDGWLAIIVGVLALTLAAVGAVAYSLAGQVAVLRARPIARGALEIEAEGPPTGSDSPLIERFQARGGELALAVFTSPGCAMCVELTPAVDALAERPGVEVVVFDEERDILAWRVSAIPGSPYAVAMNAQGLVLAKGTFNTAEQLESIPTTALWRAADAQHV
jgi:hypothetical protein